MTKNGFNRERSLEWRPWPGLPARAFSLIELLVVLAIIGILAAVGLPKLATFGKSNAEISATRQLLDDIAFARTRAIANRSDVYMLFIPPDIINVNTAGMTTNELTLFTSLLGGQYTTYTFFANRSVGEQPGRSTPRYLTPWKTLPQGTFIATNVFMDGTSINSVTNFNRKAFPFPLATSTTTASLRYIQFNCQGQVVSENDRDRIIPMARGSIFYARDANGQFIAGPADIIEKPPGNAITLSNHVRIDWLTGRARVERQEIQ